MINIDKKLINILNVINNHNINSDFCDFIDFGEFTYLVYVDHNHIIPLSEKQNSQVCISTLNMQSPNAKIAQLRIFIYELSESNLFCPIINIQEIWISDESDNSLL